ncbi:hypothetical protein CFC21_016415 [Triticum aestivum]|uniref:Cyclin N-terminal domain-containing protein n=2 Tax=Triticum aestivum TaxID=4565 RepID=A0A9R1DZ14_WHEAT|nr:hypothetical protein CFC21_016415 [Triticum aestivum]
MDMPGEDEYVYGYEYEFDLENPFTSPADEPIASLLDAEAHHAPSVSAAASAVRRDAARFISKVRYDGELAVHPRVAYLALNYVDRFLSKGQLPFERKPWAPRLLAISCLSIAAKMQRVDAISMDYIQEKLRECGEVMAAVCGVVGVGVGPAASAETPVTVLGHGHYRSASSESDRTVGSAANVADAKKRCMGPPSQSQWG